jgi:broad specificity phosphatase PhoE
MKTFYLIRHGQTESNLNRIVGTATDKLSWLGRRQAQLVGERLKMVGAQKILCSPYVRTRETADAINASVNLEIEYSEHLIESRSPKEVEGKSTTDPKVMAIRKEIHQWWGDPQWHYSNEENFADVSARARHVLKLLAAREEDTLIVVTHAAFMRMLAEVVMLGDLLEGPHSTALYNSLFVNNTGVTVIRLKDSGKWELVRWNDTVHLEPETESD